MNNQLRKPSKAIVCIVTTGLLVSGCNVMTSVSKAPVIQTAPAYSMSKTKVLKLAKAITPIQHVVVIYDENVSFDHYFATYPEAANPPNEPPFYPTLETPSVNGLSAALLNNNPNQANPKRLDRSHAMTADMDHGYTAEQQAFDGGLMDKFVQSTGHGDPMVMDYYDGNTVTAMWNYAQHFALNDNFFGTTDGPSTIGALNLVSGQTHGATAYRANVAKQGEKLWLGDKGYPGFAINSNGTLYDDIDPYYDAASSSPTVQMSGLNIGDLLNENGLTWGWFQGGFDNPTTTHKNIGGQQVTDYIPHHEPFEYYSQSSNISHVKPSSVAMIGHSDQANHQYDLSDFWAAADAGNMPNFAVLKAPGYEDGHPGYSDPIDEQRWLVETVNKLESLPAWKTTAIFITYDDSDGWYDHVMPPIVSKSNDPNTDALTGTGQSGTPPAGTYLDRAGYGPRLPLIVISPYAKHNAVVNSIGDQSSIIRFVEDNWSLGRLGNQSFDVLAGSLGDMFDFSADYYNPPVFLDPITGEPVASVKPFKQNGQLYMAVQDLAQSLDVRLQQNGKYEWFMYGSHLVEVPSEGSMVIFDMKSVKLESPIVEKGSAVWLPINNLSKALGLQPSIFKANEILFKSKN